MTPHLQVAVWIDHHQARIFHVRAETFDESTVSAPQHRIHRHPKGSTEEHHHPDDLPHFFHEVADAVGDAEQILVVGPSTVKIQFRRYLQEHAPALATRVVELETADHPTDRQFVAHVAQHFGLARTHRR